MSDDYEKAKHAMIAKHASILEIDFGAAKKFYDALVDEGLIDYDIEKEVYLGEEDEYDCYKA